GASYRVIAQTTVNPQTGPPSTSRYTEISDGMHYWNGQWQESRDLIEIAGDQAVAQYGPAKVIFSGNLNVPGAIDLTSPNGNRLRSQPLGLYYFDRVSGQTVALAAVKDWPAT